MIATGRPALALHDPQAMRHAQADLLSLALLDTRNRLLAAYAAAVDSAGSAAASSGSAASGAGSGLAATETSAADSATRLAAVATATRLALGVAAFQERWITCHLQAARGEAAAADAPRLPGRLAPPLREWLDAGPDAWAPDAQAVRSLLADVHDAVQDLLPRAEGDAGLYFFRLALHHEDRATEQLVMQAQLAAPATRQGRAPLWLPAQTGRIGAEPAPPGRDQGYVPHGERWAHEVAVPEFEIDAQVVSWDQFAEFAEDHGYDRPDLWSEAGWAWLQAGARRAPRHVEQLSGGVLITRRGKLQRAPGAQPAHHVSRHEAEAWCRWAGRRLPTEPEWEIAAASASRRGFLWGEVLEWVAGRARAWPGAGAMPAGTLDALPAPGGQADLGVLRGAAQATAPRWRTVTARRFVPPAGDEGWFGFRTCAL